MKQKTSKNDEEENLSDEDIDEAKSALLSYVSSDDRNEIELSVERETKEFWKKSTAGWNHLRRLRLRASAE